MDLLAVLALIPDREGGVVTIPIKRVAKMADGWRHPPHQMMSHCLIPIVQLVERTQEKSKPNERNNKL